MRGADIFTESLFTMRLLGDYVPADHPLRPGVASEKLLRAMLRQVFYSARPERQLLERTQYNLLFRWFGWFNFIVENADQIFVLTIAAYNLTRMRSLRQIRPQTA